MSSESDEARFRRNLGPRLRALREFHGLDSGQWAKALGLEKATWDNYESGRRGIPYHILARVAHVAGVPIGLLFLGWVSPISDEQAKALTAAFPVMKETAWEPSQDDWQALRAARQPTKN